MVYETLLVERMDAVATVTLNRAAALNALNAQMFTELEQVFEAVATDASVRVVVITGAGEKAFAAGADIKELAALDQAAGHRLALRGQAVFALVERCGKPVIAAVNGFALGGGCELALACTFRLASETARLGTPEVKLGLIPGYGATQRLPRLIGRSAALQMMLTGDMVSAAEALRLGLVDAVYPAGELMAAAQALAAKIAAQAPLAVAGCLEAVSRGAELGLDDALAVEAHIFGRLSATSDKQEGLAAFLGKRPAVFTGR